MIAAFVAAGLLWGLSRARQYRQAAGALGFAYRGTAFPDSLDVTRLSFWNSGDSASDVITGKFREVETAVFLFHHIGDLGYEQTRVAMKSKATLAELSSLWRASEIRAEKIDERIVIFRQGETIGPSKLSEFLQHCRSLIEYFEDRRG